MSEENLRNIGKQLIEAGQQLVKEAEEKAVALDTVDWEKVRSGEQEAPPLMDDLFFIPLCEEGVWIYAGVPLDKNGPCCAWESCCAWGVWLSPEEAIAKLTEKREHNSALYKYKDGIAELVYSNQTK